MREHGFVQRPSFLLVLALVLLFLAGQSRAGTASASLKITVRVVHVHQVQVLSQPADFEVTERDIARGYVDVPSPMVVSVVTDSPSFKLVLARTGAHVRGVRVEGLPEEVRFTSDAAVVWQATARAQTLQLRVQFDLAPGLTPGKYPWALMATSLAL